MKKGLVIFSVLFMIVLIAVMSFGIQIGNVRIGNQNDTLGIIQKSEIDQSEFSKKYLESDKIICVNLWATWCEPCLAEIPMLNQIKSDFSEKNIEFLSFSVDKDSVKLVKFNKSDRFYFKDITVENLEYRNAIVNYLENKPADNSINSLSIPKTYLIKNKKVVKTFDGSFENKQELVDAINSVL
ncbi:MAG: TlpA family protein disulfide reductase [Flavobacterium sp.]